MLEKKLTDGGLIINNPTELAIWHSTMLFDRKPGLIVSIGTGFPPADKRATGDKGIHDRVKASQPLETYYRLNVDNISHIALNDKRPETLDMLVTKTQEYCMLNAEQLQSIALKLVALAFHVDSPCQATSNTVSFLVKPRVPKFDLHWSQLGSIEWQTKGGLKQSLSLEIRVTDNTAANLSCLVESKAGAFQCSVQATTIENMTVALIFSSAEKSVYYSAVNL